MTRATLRLKKKKKKKKKNVREVGKSSSFFVVFQYLLT